MSTPYIGVNDLMNPDQVERMLSFWYRNQPPGLNRRFHIGVTMTNKTLRGITCKWTNAVPKNEEIKDIFYFRSPETMRCLHYADYRQEPAIQGDLERAIRFGGSGMNALQLDMIWPTAHEILHAVRVCEREDDLEIILQVGRDAFTQVNNNPYELGRYLQRYLGTVHYVLLDLSMGTGTEMNPDLLEPFIEEIQWRVPRFEIGVAGGLGPGRLEHIKTLIQKHPKLSFDAQSWIRPNGNVLDPMDEEMAKAFLLESIGITSKM